MVNLSKILFLLLFLSSCSLTSTYYVDPIYEDHPHTVEVYYYGADIYFGYHSGFYYYYGVPHFYPWWYYYQFIPPYNFYTHTHVHVHCDNGHYVYGHRGPTLNNNVVKDFTPTIKVKNNKDKSFIFPRDWKSSNSTRINKQNNIKYNINRPSNNKPIINNNKPIINNKSNNNRPNRNNKSNRNKPRK